MYEVKIGNEWLDVVRIEKDGGVLALYDGKFRVFAASAYDEVREKAEEKPTVKRTTRKAAVKDDGKK